MRIDFRALSALVKDHEIGYAYSFLDYDYEKEVRYSKGLCTGESRARFLSRMSWVAEPTTIEVRRLFNQINSFYAEKWAIINSHCPASVFLAECNQLILFRQGKKLGLRGAEIEFGIRVDLDSLDPRRQFKQLRGITPPLISSALDLWIESVCEGPGDADLVLALMMLLIAIHPFYDGNGRLGRLAYTWLRARWGLPPIWLAEDAEGEFLRTGTGLASTEYLMAAVLLQACAGHNRVGYGPREDGEDGRALESLKVTLQNIRTLHSLVNTDSFKRFRLHLQEEGHFRKTSPRFESLRNILR